PRLPAAQAD
ncbi:hypothetical protein BN1708_017809, partial [Verticillium longisporum]